MGKRARLKRLKKEQSSDSQILPSRKPLEFKLGKKIERVILLTLFIIILSLGIGLRLSHLDISRRSPDEGVYTYQANKIAEHGLEGTRQLIDEYNADKQLWVYPPPTRIGYGYLLAAVMKISGNHNEAAGTYLSVFASIGTLLLLLLMGLRFFNPWITLIALLGMSVSAMDLAIARRCWQDSLLAFVGTLFIYLCAELVKNPKRRMLYIPILIAGSYCMLIKESGIVIFGLGLLWLLLQAGFKERSFSQVALALATGILGAVISFFILVKTAGGISSVFEIFKHVKEAMPTNTYALEYQTGPWYGLIEGFWIMAPLFTILALSGAICLFLKGALKNIFSQENAENDSAIRGIILFAAAFIAIAIITPYCQNMRYVSVAFAPFYLLAGFGVWQTIRFLNKKLGNFYLVAILTIVIIVIAVATVRDYQFFKRVFVDEGIVDVSLGYLRQYS